MSFQIVVLKKTLESPLGIKIKPVNPKGNQPWIFFERTDAETEAPKLWPPDAKRQVVRKDPDTGKDWRQQKGVTEDEMVGWYHQLNGHEFEQALGDGEGHGILGCCSPWGSQSQTWLRDWITTINPIDNIYTYTPDILLFLFCPIT